MSQRNNQNGKWNRVTLGDYFRIKHGFAFKGEFFTDSGPYILLTPGNFKRDGGIHGRGEREKYYVGEFPGEFLLKRGDLLVVMTDLTQDAPILGSPGFITADHRFLHNQRLGKIVDLNESEIDQRFLYYLFNSSGVRAQIKATATGATVKHTAPERIYSIQVELPPISLQRRTASILSAYDDLIDNNTHRIKILEEMAQALYREWFVHFRFPGHERCRLANSALGAIPEDWELTTMGTLYETASGGTPSRKVPEYFGGSTNWLKTQELNDGFVFGTGEQITEAALARSSAKVFPVKTVLVAMYGATIGMLGILAVPAATNQACCALLQKLPSFGYSYAFLTLLTRRADLIGLRLGAAQQNINQVLIRNFKVLRPTQVLMISFNNMVDPIFDSIRCLQQRNQVLRQTRDLLLPKLMSGKVALR